MAFTAFLVLSLALAQGIKSLRTSNEVYVISEDLYTYAFSCASGQLVAISANQKSLLFYDFEKEQPGPESLLLPKPGELLQVSEDAKTIAVAHKSYLSVITNNADEHVLKTYSIISEEVASIVIIEQLICVFPAESQESNNMECFSITTGNVSQCSYIIDTSMAYANFKRGWVYVTSQDSLAKYNVSKKSHCLEPVQNSNSGVDDDNFGDYLWFSYDGSRIFLDNGMTLYSASGDLDMKPHGDFNSTYNKLHYAYFSQSSESPYDVAGIEKDSDHMITYYSWPYLQPLRAEPVPVPPNSEIVGAQEVHVCDLKKMTFVISKYFLLANGTKIGVATKNTVQKIL